MEVTSLENSMEILHEPFRILFTERFGQLKVKKLSIEVLT